MKKLLKRIPAFFRRRKVRNFTPAKIVEPLGLQGEINALRDINSTKPKEKRLVVHLGNVHADGGVPPAMKTTDYAQRFKKVTFVGIDVMHQKPNQKNWKQLQMDFIEGLKTFKNNSTDIISSEMAIGYYGSQFVGTEHSKTLDYKEHAFNTVKYCHQKLKPKGKLMVAVDSSVFRLVEKAMLQAGFKKENINFYEIKGKELARTFWLYEYDYKPKRFSLKKGKFYQLIAQK